MRFISGFSSFMMSSTVVSGRNCRAQSMQEGRSQEQQRKRERESE
jgi:hypothetical protein